MTHAMCARDCGRRAYLKLHVRNHFVWICDTCSGELYRAGLIKTLGAALVVPASPNRTREDLCKPQSSYW